MNKPSLRTYIFLMLTLSIAIACAAPTTPIARKIKADREVIYKSVGEVELKLHVFEPKDHKKTDHSY